MTVSNIKAAFPEDIRKVWETVTDFQNYTWRSDLSKTERLSEKKFVEYTKQGYPTTFTVTVTEPYRRWEFDMENGNIKGHWSGIFTQKDGETQISLTESVTAKKLFMRLFLKAYLKKQQRLFVSDLKTALQNKTSDFSGE